MDLMHDCLLKAIEKMDHYHYKGPRSLYSWLARVAINESINHLRKEERLQITVLEKNMAEEDGPIPEESLSLPDSVLLRMISSLPDSQRVVLNLFCIDGFSHKEIAERLGISEKTSSSTLARAKKTLTKMITDYNNIMRQNGR